MVKVLVNGAAGRMGQAVCRLLAADDRFELVGAADASCAGGLPAALPEVPADVIIDFSFHTAAPALAEFAVKNGSALVVGTTGHTPQERAALTSAADKVAVFISSNMSLGVALLAKLAQQAAAAFPKADIEIMETHHNKKADAPSGTALTLADAIRQVRTEARNVCAREGHCPRQPDEIGIQSLRMGNAVGTHEIYFATEYETVTLRHEAHDRTVFAQGALSAAAYLAGKPAGLYTMSDYIGEMEK